MKDKGKIIGYAGREELRPLPPAMSPEYIAWLNKQIHFIKLSINKSFLSPLKYIKDTKG